MTVSAPIARPSLSDRFAGLHRLIGNTPQMNISLPAGSHRVTLVNPDFNIRQSVSVTIEAGQVTTRVLTLDRPE